jgi:type II secretory pathway pseudopilin PulG
MLKNTDKLNILKNNQGFTLVEIMTSTLMMGTLAYFGITATFDTVGDMKKQTKMTKIASDYRATIGSALKDANFQNAQTNLVDCMTGNTIARQTCYNNTEIVDPKNPSVSLAAGPEAFTASLADNGKTAGKAAEGSDNAGKIAPAVGLLQVNEFCDMKEGSTLCKGNQAQYAEVKITYMGYNAKEAVYDQFLFEVSSIISNQKFNYAKSNNADGCTNTYADSIGADLSTGCTQNDAAKMTAGLTANAIKGNTGRQGPNGLSLRGPTGPRGSKGPTVCYHPKGGGIALSGTQHNALNRLQGPARIIGGGGGSVRVVNKHGSQYSMSKSSITGWASRGGGCFEQGTVITMADGSKAPIENIKKGDLVWNPLTKKPALVKKGVKGPEEFIMYAFMVNGEEVKVTKTHPMLTDRGTLKAEDVRADDRMLWKSGELLEIESITTYKTENDVYNLFLVSEDGKDIEGAVIANGVITGDLDMQQKLENSPVKSAKLSH